MAGVRVSFLVEVEGSIASFTPKSERCFEASLTKSNTEAMVSTIRTSNCFSLPATVDEHQNVEP
jgi:hypothetical protein